MRSSQEKELSDNKLESMDISTWRQGLQLWWFSCTWSKHSDELNADFLKQLRRSNFLFFLGLLRFQCRHNLSRPSNASTLDMRRVQWNRYSLEQCSLCCQFLRSIHSNPFDFYIRSSLKRWWTQQLLHQNNFLKKVLNFGFEYSLEGHFNELSFQFI